MERAYAAELNDQNLSAIFGECDDFIRRELWVEGQAVYVYALDGMVSSGFMSDYILKPLAQGAVTGDAKERCREARAGAVYNADSYAMTRPAPRLAEAVVDLYNFLNGITE